MGSGFRHCQANHARLEELGPMEIRETFHYNAPSDLIF
jgi:hypothetical protein